MYSTRRASAVPLSIRLPEDLEARLTKLANRTGRSKSYYVTEAIREHLTDLEDIYTAERRLSDIRAGRIETVPLEEVMTKHGLAG
ncbi:MAG: type II toxin-antitoxin system RelB family antitoxin [Gemmataceae bacterium]